MFIREYAIAASVLALAACTGAQADRGEANIHDEAHDDHFALVINGPTHDVSWSGMSREEQLELNRDISEGVREALSEARREISEALTETRRERADHDINTHIDGGDLSNAIVMSVQSALQEAQRELKRAERRLGRDEDRLARQARHMARQAERLGRRAEEMEARAKAMTRDAERMRREEERLRRNAPKMPKAPAAPKSGKSTSEEPAPAVGMPRQLHNPAFAPYVH